MNNLKIKFETLPQRCEVCHQRDCFDAERNYCSRCASLTDRPIVKLRFAVQRVITRRIEPRVQLPEGQNNLKPIVGGVIIGITTGLLLSSMFLFDEDISLPVILPKLILVQIVMIVVGIIGYLISKEEQDQSSSQESLASLMLRYRSLERTRRIETKRIDRLR